MALVVKTRYRCNAPVGDGKCGQLITNAVCDPIELPSTGMFRNLAPGPTITHLPCGHEWWRGQGWEPRIERVPWATDDGEDEQVVYQNSGGGPIEIEPTLTVDWRR